MKNSEVMDKCFDDILEAHTLIESALPRMWKIIRSQKNKEREVNESICICSLHNLKIVLDMLKVNSDLLGDGLGHNDMELTVSWIEGEYDYFRDDVK